MRDGKKYELDAPLKNVRENKVYTVKESDLKKITCDDNGAYIGSKNVTTHYLVEDIDQILTAKKVHKSDDSYYINIRQGQTYVATPVEKENVYLLERYYRQNKSIPNLRRIIVRVKRVTNVLFEPYICVVFNLNGDAKDVSEVKLLEHGNSKHSGKRPYIRTSQYVLEQEDELLSGGKRPHEVYDILVEESGGPFASTSSSTEPRNLKQIQNRKQAASKANVEDNGGNDDLFKLIVAQRNPENLIKTVTVTGESYLAFAYTQNQIQDIEKFCASELEASVLAVDTTFNLCDMWITDTSYRNKRLLNPTTRKHPVFLGPIMIHFSKTEKTFGRFALELVSANPNLKHLKKIGVDLESAIFKGFKNMIPTLKRLVCVFHLKKRDESKLSKLLERTGRSATEKKHALAEIIKDIYGLREGNFYEAGIAEASDEEDFMVKLESLQTRWDILCPGFYPWFQVQRKSLFLESVIQSAREKTDISGLYYQNDIESKHAAEKRNQNFKKESILVAVANIHAMVKREENDEVRAIYGAGNYVLSNSYKVFQVPSHIWHSWSGDRKKDHIEKFRCVMFFFNEIFNFNYS